MKEGHMRPVQSKSMDWFLYDKDLHHKRVKVRRILFEFQFFSAYVETSVTLKNQQNSVQNCGFRKSRSNVRQSLKF